MRSGKHYKKLTLDNGKQIDEHRFIMQQMIGRELGFNEVVHHNDEDKNNNETSNFSLMSRSEHSRLHAEQRVYNEAFSETMRSIALSQMTGSKLNEAQVLEIRKQHGEGVTPKDLQKRFKVAKRTIHDIISRTTWKHI